MAERKIVEIVACNDDRLEAWYNEKYNTYSYYGLIEYAAKSYIPPHFFYYKTAYEMMNEITAFVKANKPKKCMLDERFKNDWKNCGNHRMEQ